MEVPDIQAAVLPVVQATGHLEVLLYANIAEATDVAVVAKERDISLTTIVPITTRVRAAMEAENASTAMVVADRGKEMKVLAYRLFL